MVNCLYQFINNLWKHLIISDDGLSQTGRKLRFIIKSIEINMVFPQIVHKLLQVVNRVQYNKQREQKLSAFCEQTCAFCTRGPTNAQC